MRQAGDVQYVKIMESYDGRSKGCGIVDYTNPEDARNAIRTLHDSELLGRKMLVREDREAGNDAPPRAPPREERFRGRQMYAQEFEGRDPMRASGRREGRGRYRDIDRLDEDDGYLDDELESYFKRRPLRRARAADELSE
uniref:Rna recognition motif-containing protein n=1 Tax=Tetraselmis sp. GSL018 TaxID=582737 RepID=A0A061RF67_9CHLO|eukprot:CAMPEP_0177588608 /NCGR_PEP_ID=MMETSP0419_2-20121207/6319_1 /TAXON_ID=582737 /ORGANISM="Tetraselmis sp., Strain GSL018" /LENGTH=139 /DNA_ID=CAMNT_0019078823 /DNA_START=699 /DNA_END=1118 /DNA_ORIENTATION=+